MRPGSDENWRNERTVSGSDRLPVFIELDFGAALKEQAKVDPATLCNTQASETVWTSN